MIRVSRETYAGSITKRRDRKLQMWFIEIGTHLGMMCLLLLLLFYFNKNAFEIPSMSWNPFIERKKYTIIHGMVRSSIRTF